VLEQIRAQSRHMGTTDLGDRRGLAALEHVAKTYLHSYETGYRGGRTMFVAIVESISSTPELLELTTETDESFREAIAERLREAIAHGELAESTDVATFSVLVVGLLRGIGLQWLVSARAVSLDEVVPSAMAMIRSSLEPQRPTARPSGTHQRRRTRAPAR
jgi:AcrR family transcriptional regulator